MEILLKFLNFIQENTLQIIVLNFAVGERRVK